MEERRRSRAWALLALLVLPAVAGVGWWSGRASLQAADAGADADSRPPSTPDGERPLSAADRANPVRRLPDGPLPDLALPLRDTLPELKRRADAGEAAAACRLAAEMEYCDRIRQRLDAASAMLADPDARGMAGAAPGPDAEARLRDFRQAIAAGSERLLEQSTHCEGVPDFGPGDRVRYWRNAALGGNVAALRHYAVGNAFRMNETLDSLDALRVYRSEAEAMALRAVAAGDLPATLALASAYSPQRRGNRRYLLAQSVQPDAGHALALYLHARSRLRDDTPSSKAVQARLDATIRELEAGMAPAALAQARTRAAAYPPGAPALPMDIARASIGVRAGATADIDRQDCAPPP